MGSPRTSRRPGVIARLLQQGYASAPSRLGPDDPVIQGGAIASLIQAARAVGVPVGSALEVLGHDERTLSRPSARLSWNQLRAVFQELERRGLTDEHCREMGRSMTRSKHLLATWLAGVVLRPELFYLIGYNWISPRIFPVVEHRFELGRRRVTVGAEVSERFAPCRPFFVTSLAFMAHVPALLGQPLPQVSATVGSRRYDATILLQRRSRVGFQQARVMESLNAVGYAIRALLPQKRVLKDALVLARALEEQFVDAIDGFRDAALVTRDGTIAHANPAAVELLGYADRQSGAELLRGRDIWDFCFAHDRGRARDACEQGGEFRVVRLDQSILLVDMPAVQPVVFENRRGQLWMLRDVSERRRQEQQLVMADRVASMGTLSAGLAHEINNPLTLTMTNLELARRAPLADVHTRNKHLDAALEGAARIREITRDLSRLSASRSAETSVDVAEVLRAAARFVFADSSNIPVRLDLGACPRAWGSFRSVGQIALNVLLNGKHAVTERGDGQGAIEIRLAAEGDEVVAEFEDNGGGIAPEAMARIFDPFYTTRTDGSGLGLGLAMSRALAREMQGTLDLRSEHGRGTIATLRLRRAQEHETAQAAHAMVDVAGRRRLLLVDDEEAILRTLVLALEDLFEVTCASSGREALAILSEDDGFDAILCDVQMPDGDGTLVYQWVAANRPHLVPHLTFMSGGSSRAFATRIVGRAECRFLQKPFADVESLRAAMLRSTRNAAPRESGP